ncbi:MAG: hypothetical protein GX844_01540 [Alcaligenaceae bacterium]|jgi:hypothetical protein|nr:hypothetical protein [Alcaligenaceae bacterium]
MKKIVFLALAAMSLSACVQAPIYPPMTETEMNTVTCRQLWKESEKLNRVINNVRYDHQFSTPQGRDLEVLEAAQKRLEQVREASVQKMCTYG